MKNLNFSYTCATQGRYSEVGPGQKAKHVMENGRILYVKGTVL